MKALDILFTFLHVAVISFNLFGWIWNKTRKTHLVVVAATAASWFLLGIWKGWGYCFLTDWHWRIKEKNGETDLPDSFIKYAADGITGKDINAALIDSVTLYIFILVVIFTLYLNFIQGKLVKK